MLVAVERHFVGLSRAVEHRGDLRQPLNIGIALAAYLELEVNMAIGGDDLFQALRQPVVQALALCVSARDGVDKTNGVARENRIGRFQAGEKSVEVEAGKVRRQHGPNPEPIVAHQSRGRYAFKTTERIDDRALDQRYSKRRDQAIQAHSRAFLAVTGIRGG